jgi:hypothetical protein
VSLLRPKVYITNKGFHDYSSARQYGTLVTLTEGLYKLTGVGKILRTIKPILKNSKKSDYLLVCGPNVLNILAACLLVMKHQRLNLLIYVDSPGGGAYVKRVVELKEEMG